MFLLLLACTAPRPTAPDIVLVSLDTTRADALSAQGNPRPITPELDRIAAAGTRFAWALSAAPSTLSSHSTVFTGLDPHGTRIVRNGYPLDAAFDTLTERLAGAGWDAIAVIGSSALERPMGIEQGFRIWDERFSVVRQQRHESTAREVTDRALARITERDPARPLFLFAHYYDAHSPYDAPEPYKHRWSRPEDRGRFGSGQGVLRQLAEQLRTHTADPRDLDAVVNLYYGEVSYVDAEVGRLVAGLPHPDNTLLLVFGDHGDMFGEDPLRPFGHGGDVDLPVTHVPLLIRGPGVPAGVVDTPVGLRDVAATILELAGQPPDLGGSTSLVPYLHGATTPRTYFIEATQPGATEATTRWNNLPNERAVLRGTDLLIRNPMNVVEQQYRVSTGQPPAPTTAELATALTRWDETAPPWRTVDMSGDTREGLKALGYVE